MKRSTPREYYNFIIALSGPYGAGCSSVATEMVKIIDDLYGCRGIRVKVSDLIKGSYKKTFKKEIKYESNEPPYIRKALQGAGNELRKINPDDPEFLGKLIAAEITKHCSQFEKEGESGLNDEIYTIFTIVDSLKNQNDYKALKSIFREELFMVFVHSNAETRWQRMLKYKKWEEKHRALFFKLDRIDSNEKEENEEVGNAGQEVGKLSPISDYYIVNSYKDLDELRDQGDRFLELLLGTIRNQPTFHERAMHLAYSASNRSYCLSRQVGAAIVDKHGNILGVGHNDVPKAEGGLYTQEESPEDKRCYKTGDRRCINDLEKEKRFEKLCSDISSIYEEITKKHNCEIAENLKPKIENIIKNSEFRELTEYCRAVHAEMEALLSVSRATSGSTQGAWMYVTTQPCHNCAKHILCSGIKRAYFIEPYPKSLAQRLWGESIIIDPSIVNDKENKLLLLPYEGVAPKRFHDFFSFYEFEERKDKQGFALANSKRIQAKKPRFAHSIRSRSRLSKTADEKMIAELLNARYVINKDRNKSKEEESDAKGGNIRGEGL